jgi:hypothetical protein
MAMPPLPGTWRARLRRALTRAALAAAAFIALACPAHAQSNTDDLPTLAPPYETLRYSVVYDGGANTWAYEVRLYTDRSVLYLGRGKVKTAGRRQFRLSEEQYDTLLRAFEYADFMRMRNPARGGRDTALVLTHTREGRSHTVYTGDPGPGWSRPFFQLVWSIESMLQVQRLACPIEYTMNKDPVDACQVRAKAMDQGYPRR